MTDLQTKADAMAETINAIAALCTYQHESKADFIGRVRAVLGDDPDLRVSSVRQQRDELLSALELFMDNVDPPPDKNCRCHVSPPCCDCVDYGGLREAFSEARAAIASVKGVA